MPASREILFRVRHATSQSRENIVRLILIPLVAATAAALAAGAAAQSVDPNLARSLAATCANCHGTGGVSVGEVESLAGKPKDELVRKMQDFKTGKRPATIMHQLAKGYTDEQIDLVCGWFAAQKPPAK
jgi:sulfide dehydrogenase cytochrome subunit